MTKQDSRRFLRSLAEDSYNKSAEQDHSWSLGSVIDAVVQRAMTLSVDRQILELTVEGIVKGLDEERRERLGSGQVDLFTLEEESLDGVLALGDGLRVKLRYAELSDFDNWYALQLRNYNAVTQAHSNKTNFYSRVRPELAANGGTVGEAWNRMRP